MGLKIIVYFFRKIFSSIFHDSCPDCLVWEMMNLQCFFLALSCKYTCTCQERHFWSCTTSMTILSLHFSSKNNHANGDSSCIFFSLCLQYASSMAWLETFFYPSTKRSRRRGSQDTFVMGLLCLSVPKLDNCPAITGDKSWPLSELSLPISEGICLREEMFKKDSLLITGGK